MPNAEVVCCRFARSLLISMITMPAGNQKMTKTIVHDLRTNAATAYCVIPHRK